MTCADEEVERSVGCVCGLSRDSDLATAIDADAIDMDIGCWRSSGNGAVGKRG